MLHVARGLFIAVCALLGWNIGAEVYEAAWWQGMAVGATIGACCVVLELSFARRFIGVISVLMFGIVVGFIASHMVLTALDLIPGLRPDAKTLVYRDFGVTFVLSFVCVLAILHAKDDFKFVIPFVELKREGPGGRPLLLDTSVVIDGRIADLVAARAFDGRILVPRFVLDELHQVADSADKGKRARGRRGLDVLARLREGGDRRVTVEDATLPEIDGVDAKLVKLAKLLDARLVTLDANLNKIAQVQGVDVVNLNDLAAALRPPLLQGDRVTLRVLKAGEGAGQGVGYLADGTMVVAEDCAARIGQDVDLVVTNLLQTSAGRMVFGRPAPREEAPSPAAR